MTAAAWIQFGLLLLPKVTVGLDHFVAWLHDLRATAEQTGEWTPELREQFRAALLAKGLADWEQPDAPES